MKALALLTVLVLAAAATAACGGDDASAELSLEQAVDHDGPAVVRGNLLALGDDVRLCAALAESFPPQCGGASVVVAGLDLARVDGLVTEGDVSWTDRPVSLEGVLADGVLTVDENALA